MILSSQLSEEKLVKLVDASVPQVFHLCYDENKHILAPAKRPLRPGRPSPRPPAEDGVMQAKPKKRAKRSEVSDAVEVALPTLLDRADQMAHFFHCLATI